MSQKATQIKVTVPFPLMDYLVSRAGKYGMSLSSYVKHLIINDVKDMDFPVMQASERTEQAYEQALREQDKAVEVDDVATYLDRL